MNLETRIVIIDNYIHYGSFIEEDVLILYQDVIEEGSTIRRYFQPEDMEMRDYKKSKVYRFYKEEVINK